jgi:hypothetical protein
MRATVASESWVPVLIAVLLVGSALSGCVGTETESTTPVEPSTNDTQTAPDAPERAVVADIGPGTNPYHEAFRETRETLYPWPNESES